MKRLRLPLFTLLLFCFKMSDAQETINSAYNFKILKMTAFTEQVTDCYGNCRIERYSFFGDTTINNVNYVKMYLENGMIADYVNATPIIYYEVVGAVRETTDSLVYFYDIAANREVLLYDFGWNKDKQILSTSEEGVEYTYAFINDLDTIEQNGWKTPIITTLSGGKCLQGIGDVDGFSAPMRRGNVPKCEMWNQQLWCAIDERVNCICPLYQAHNSDDCETCRNKMTNITQSIVSVAILSQNTPNPFNNQTEINYYLPVNAENAVLYVFSLNGNMLLSKPLTKTGNGSITISGLEAGMYIYTLAIGGVEVDSKRMIITKE